MNAIIKDRTPLRYELTDAAFERATEMIFKMTGIRMTPRNRIMLKGRLQRVARGMGLATIDAYLDLVSTRRRQTDDVQTFIDLVTTHKTSFFRTRSIWRFLHETLGGEYGKSLNKTLSIWSAASSTGEEPASIAMVCEAHQATNPSFRYRIFASDVSRSMVKATAQQQYDATQRAAAAAAAPAGVAVDHLFDEVADGVRLKRSCRDAIIARQHNLFETPPTRFHIVFMRNVIIYFSDEQKKLALECARRSLYPGGYLIIGESESILDGDGGFSYVQPCVYTAKS